MKRQARGKFDRGKVKNVGDVTLPKDLHQKVIRQTEIADDECRINFRWGTAQLTLIKQVAELMGISYQQYIKQVLFRQAHADLQQFKSSTVAETPGKYSRREAKTKTNEGSASRS